ncbi:MAG: hypothetical protein ABI611_22380 [Solirubrobacteraceae bacterium]
MLGRTLVVVVVLLGPCAATPAAEGAKKVKRCKASQVKTKVTIAHPRHRVTVCLPRAVKRPASVPAAWRKARAIALKHVSRRVARALRTKAARRVRRADAVTDRALAGAVAVARAAKVTHESDTQTLRSPPGTRTIQRRDGTEWDDEEPNPGTEKKIAIDTTSVRIAGLSSSKATRLELTNLMSRCPDASGIGHGTINYLHSERQTVTQGSGGSLVHERRDTFDATVLVHFDDQADVTSVDVKGDWKFKAGSFSAGGGLTATAGANGHVADFNVTVANANGPGATAVGVLLGTIGVLVPIDSTGEMVSGSARRAGNGTCAKILPDPTSVHVKPSQTVEISAGLRDAKDEALTGLVKATAATASVTPEAQADPVARFTYAALSSVPAGRTDTVTLKHVSRRGRAREQTVTIIYDDPPEPPLPNHYSGTVSGRWDSVSSFAEHWTYTGSVALEYAGDDPFAPPGGPPDRYRRFHVTSGTAHVIVNVTYSGGCGYKGNGDVTFDVGDQSGSMSVQATARPAYLIGLSSRNKFITVTKTGAGSGCNAGETMQAGVPGIWAQTRSAHTTTSSMLEDSEDDSTPESPFDYDTVSKWKLTPSP